MMKRRRVGIAVAMAVAAGGGGVAWRHRQESAPAVDPSLWQRRFPQPDGGELALASLQGRPLLINFWATWCAPCVKEMPALDRFHREFGPRGWQVVGVAIDRKEPVIEFLKRLPVGFPIALAGFDGSEFARQLGNDSGALPFSVVVDAKGRVVQRKLGETSYDELVRWAEHA